MSFLSNKSTTKTTQTQKGSAEQEAQYKQYFQELGDFTQAGPQQYFPDQAVAGLTPEQLQAQQAAMQFAQGGAGNILGQLQGAAGTAGNMMGMAGQDPSSQPGFQQMADYLTQRSNQNFSENLAPQIRGGSIANSMYGGSRGADATGLAGARTQEGLDGTIGQMLMQAYGQNNSNALNAMGMMPGLAGAQSQAGMLPAEIMTGVGGQNQAMDQALINSAMDRWNFEQGAPVQHLGQVQQLQGNVGQYGGTTKTKSTTSTPFGINQAIGLGLMGASLFAPGIGTAAAAGIAGGMGKPSGPMSIAPNMSPYANNFYNAAYNQPPGGG